MCPKWNFFAFEPDWWHIAQRLDGDDQRTIGSHLGLAWGWDEDCPWSWMPRLMWDSKVRVLPRSRSTVHHATWMVSWVGFRLMAEVMTRVAALYNQKSKKRG